MRYATSYKVKIQEPGLQRKSSDGVGKGRAQNNCIRTRVTSHVELAKSTRIAYSVYGRNEAERKIFNRLY